MSQTIADLSMKIDTSDFDKAEASLKKTGEATKGVASEQSKLIDALNKATQAMTSFEKETSKVNGALKDVVSSFSPAKLGAAALATAISALSLGAMKGMVTSVIEGAAALNNLSKQTGLSVEELSVMKSVANLSGTSMDTVTGAVLKFQKAIASSAKDTTIQSKAFKELGIDTSDTSKTTEQYMAMAAQKLEGLQEGWQKNNIVMALFGKSGTEVNEFLSDYANKGDLAAKITTEQAEAAEHYERTMKKLSATANQYKQLVGMALLPVMSSLADELLKSVSNTSKLDAETKKLIASNVQEWAFNIAKGLGAAIDVGIAFWNVLKGLGMAVGAFAGAIVTSGEVLNKVLHGDIAGAWDLYKTNAKQFGEAMSDAWKTAAQDSSKYFDMVTRAQANMGKKADEGTKGSKRLPGNIGDGADTAGDKGKKDSGIDAAIQSASAAVAKLKDEIAALNGAQAKSHTAMLQAELDAGKFKDVIDKSKIATLKKIVAEEDNAEALKKVTAAQKAANEAIEKAKQTSADEIAINRIRIGLHKDLSKTMGDERVAIAAYNVQQAEAALKAGTEAQATEEKLIKLREELAIKKELLHTAQTTNADDKAAKGPQDGMQGFMNGVSKGVDALGAKIKSTAEMSQEAFTGAADAMTNSMTDFVLTGKANFKDYLKEFLAGIAKMIVQQLMLNAIKAAGSAMGFANGGAFSGGTQVFADGGVVGSPTNFGMAGGKMGLMGEAGPEAIMPLKRGSDGKLGVAMSGGQGAGSSTVVHNSMSVSIGSVNSEEEKAQLLKEMKQMMVATSKQTMADQMRQGGMLNRRVTA